MKGMKFIISGSNKVLVKKSKSSYISLEGECYNQSNAVYENGSCRETYEAFTDDDPQNGVAEAINQEVMLAMNKINIESAIIAAQSKFGSLLEVSMLPTFKPLVSFYDDVRVKKQAENGEYFRGTQKRYKDISKGAYFVPDNKEEYEKANEKKWAFKSYQISEKDMKNLPEYDPVTRNRDGIRVKKQASNGQYFTGRTDEFGMFVPDNMDAYFDADSYGNRKSIDSTLNKISKYTYVESKSSKDKKRATLCNNEDFKLYVDVLQYEGSMGVKLNLFNGNAEFAPSMKVGIEGNGKLIDFPYEFKEIQLDGSKVKVDGSVSLMSGDVGLMFDNGEGKCEAIGSFGKASISMHDIKGGIDTSAKAEGYLGALGFKTKRDFINGNCEVGAAEVIGGSFGVESKKNNE